MKPNLLAALAVSALLLSTGPAAAKGASAPQMNDSDAPEQELPPAVAAYVRQVSALAWVHGPADVRLGNQAVVHLPKGMQFLGTADTRRFLQLNGNPPNDDAYTIAPEAMSWFSILTFDAAGYVSDRETIDGGALLDQLKSTQDADNQKRTSLGQGALFIDRWLVEPHYDTRSHNLEWGMVMHGDDGQGIVNHDSRILGRDGVMRAILVTDPGNYAQDLPQFHAAISGLEYLPDKRYDAHKSGDKLAAFGLGALIAGGAAAAVAKSGLLAGLLAMMLKFGVAFYKLILLGAVALVAAFRKTIFGRRAAKGDEG